jgi:DNA-binding HxlR family transcriptional regulator
MVEIAASSFAVDGGRKSRLQGLARHILEEQDRREDYFPDVRVDEVPWRMLLLLYVSGTGRLSSESLWRSVPASPATASRWIDYLASEKLVTRHVEPSDKSRSMVELTPNGIGLLDLYLGDRLQRGAVRTEPCPENARSGRSGTPVGIVVLVTAALSAGITYLLTSFGAFARILDWD